MGSTWRAVASAIASLAVCPACLLDFDPVLLERDAGPRTLATANIHTCALRAGGAPWCWGSDEAGQLGRETPGDAPAPGPELSLRSIDVDGNAIGHSCGVDDAGGLWCWGSNGDAQLGIGTLEGGGPTPVEVPLERPAHHVALGVTVTVVRDDLGRMWTWGWNGGGRLGLPMDVSHQLSPRLLDDARHWTTLDYGVHHGCAIDEDGAMVCWGEALSGELGRADDDSMPASVEGGAQTWRTISAGLDHTCAIGRDGALWCWGSNEHGQLGRGAQAGGEAPQRVGDARDWIAVTAGYTHSCGLRRPGSLWCWGANDGGQLGVGTLVAHDLPRRVGDREDWREVVGGRAHTCGRSGDGAVWCWGLNDEGQVGSGEYIAVPSPAQILPADDGGI